MQSSYSQGYPGLFTPTSRASASTRPPIYNPYDKFTRPEFDDWIGGITSTLRKALGRDGEGDWPNNRKDNANHDNGTQFETLDEDVDDAVEDSFANLKARREKVLGKMKATEAYGGGDDEEESFGSMGQIHESGSSPGNAIELLSEGDDDDDELPGKIDAADEARVCDMVLHVSPRLSKSTHTSDVQEHQVAPEHSGDMESEMTYEFAEGFTGCGHVNLQGSTRSPSCLSGVLKDDEGQPPDVRDPWELQTLYAEGLYTGGDIPAMDKAALSPSRLFPDNGNETKYALDPSFDGETNKIFPSAVNTSNDFSKGSIRTSNILGRDTEEGIAQNDWNDLCAKHFETDGWIEGQIEREAVPEPDTPGIRERFRENLINTPSDRPSSPTFTLNDQVDWNTPSFEDRISHAIMIQDDGESESEVSSDEGGVDGSTVSDDDEDKLYERRSPIPLGTSDLDFNFEDDHDLKGHEEEDEEAVVNAGSRGSSYAGGNKVSNIIGDTDVLLDGRQRLQSINKTLRSATDLEGDDQFNLGKLDSTTDNESPRNLVNESAFIERKDVASDTFRSPSPRANSLPGRVLVAEQTFMQVVHEKESTLTETGRTNGAAHPNHIENGKGIEARAVSQTLPPETVFVTHRAESTMGFAAAASDDTASDTCEIVKDKSVMNAPEHQQDAVADLARSLSPESVTPELTEKILNQTSSVSNVPTTDAQIICGPDETADKDKLQGKQAVIVTTESCLVETLTKDRTILEFEDDASIHKSPTPVGSAQFTSLEVVGVPFPHMRMIDEQDRLDSIELGGPGCLALGLGFNGLEKRDDNADVIPIHDNGLDEPIGRLIGEPIAEGERAEKEVETKIQIPEANPDLEKDALRFTSSEVLREESQPVVESAPQETRDRGSIDSSKLPYDFIMPIIANPNVRDPTSLSHTPASSASSQPDTPQSNVSSLPTATAAITKFMRDNHLSADPVHSSSGLFTPLEGEESPIAPASSAGDNTEAEIRDDSHLLSVHDMTSSSVGLEQCAGGPCVTSRPTGSDALELAIHPDRLGVDRIPDALKLVQDGAPLTSDNNHRSTASYPSTPKLDQPVQITVELNPQLSAVDDLRDLELSYPESGTASDHDEVHDVKTYHNNTLNIEPVPGVGDVNGISDAINSVKHSVPNSRTELDDNKGGQPPEDTLRSHLVNDELKTAKSAPPVEVKTETSEGGDPSESTFLDPVPTDEGLSKVLVESAEEGSKTKMPERETTGSGLKCEDVPDVQVPPSSNNSPSGSLDRQLASTSSVEADNSVEAKQTSHTLVDKPKHPKRKRTPSVQGSSALTRSVSQGKLRTYGRNLPDAGKDITKVHPKPEAGLQPLGHNLRASNPQASSADDDLPMFHGHGNSNKRKQAVQFRKKHQPHSQQTSVAKVNPAESLQNDKSPRKPPALSISVPSQQLGLSASSSPTSPLSSTLPGEVGPTSRAISRPSSPPPASSPQTIPASRQAPVPKSTSTRSHCRYRTISLPREENGPRVTFCVPQCSLNDTELMESEEITDDGPATQRDYDKLIEHVDTLDFDPHLIGVLKLLVGVDLLRENEIYYLPQEGEVVMRRTSKGMLQKATKDSPDKRSVTDSPQTASVAGPSRKSVAPLSYAGSTSTTSSSFRRDSNRSITDNEDSDDGHVPPSKRSKWTHKAQDGDSDSAVLTPISHAKARRSQRVLKKGLSHDAQNYKPDPDKEDEDESNEEDIPKIQRRKSTRHGLKRNRTDGDIRGEESGSSPSKGGSGKSKRAKLVRKDTQDDG